MKIELHQRTDCWTNRPSGYCSMLEKVVAFQKDGYSSNQGSQVDSELAFVNLSSNLLSGDLPTCLKKDSKSRVVLYSGNCLADEDQKQHPSYLCHNEALAVQIPPPSEEKHRRTYGKQVVASSAVGDTVSAVNTAKLLSDAKHSKKNY
ncbi:hypothetical protein CerSpe_071100 [Prunus speciosa]